MSTLTTRSLIGSPLADYAPPKPPPLQPVQSASEFEADFAKLEAELKRKPLDDIAEKVRALTYGEMIELSEAIWKVKPAEKDLNVETLPGTLHEWATQSEENR